MTLAEEIEDNLEYLNEDLGMFQELKRWLFDNTLGSIHQMRIELQTRYNAKTFMVKSYDGKKIDCLFILGKASIIGRKRINWIIIKKIPAVWYLCIIIAA